MILYRSSRHSERPDGIFTHFGSLGSAAHHVHTLFGIEAHYRYDGVSFFKVNVEELNVQTLSVAEVLNNFADYAGRTPVSQYEVDVNRPLRLNDCWDDDPIGSGAMEIFDGNDDLSDDEHEALKALFAPFTKVIYPQDVVRALSQDDLFKILRRNKNNPLFHSELEKREQRSLQIYEDFNRSVQWELVWVDKTVQLREWALSRGYDSFVYDNKHEERGSESYATLTPDQISDQAMPLRFDRDRYLTATTPLFAEFARKAHAQAKGIADPRQHTVVQDIFWAGLDPLPYWQPQR